MSRSTCEIRQAIKPHKCTEYGCEIKPRDFYLYATCPPEHECSRGNKWEVIKACLRCAERYAMHNSDTRKQLELLEARP